MRSTVLVGGGRSPLSLGGRRYSENESPSMSIMFSKLVPALCVVTSMVLGDVSPSSAEEFGHFVGTVKTEWITPNREMRLLEDFVYIDPSGREWRAPKDSIIDGASIPRLLWTLVGSPFTGEYRDASVVHDVACIQRKRPWTMVHRMFYYATRSRGVDEIRAKVMYGAVYHFGPRWGEAGLKSFRPPPTERDLERLRTFIEQNNPSLKVIDSFRLR